jgi:hypothetical protein
MTEYYCGYHRDPDDPDPDPFNHFIDWCVGLGLDKAATDRATDRFHDLLKQIVEEKVASVRDKFPFAEEGYNAK